MNPLSRSLLGAAIALVVLVPAGGCGTGQGGSDDDARQPAVKRVAREGPVEVTLTLWPERVDVSQVHHLRLEVVADRSVTVSRIDYAETLGGGDHRFEFRAVPTDKEEAVPTDDGRLRWSQRFDINYFLAGEYEIPAASVSFVDVHASADEAAEATDNAGRIQTVATRPIKVLVAEGESTAIPPEALGEITVLDPVELPVQWGPWRWIAPLLLSVAAIAIVVWMRRRRRVAQEEIVVPAHEWAYGQFASLVADNLIGAGRIQEFYYRVSGIVRGYIERRYAVSAAEMTTEEFLTAAARDRRFGPDTTGELNEFLTACDLVKYARQLPATEECEGALRAAREFVAKTTARASSAGSPGEMPGASGVTPPVRSSSGQAA